MSMRVRCVTINLRGLELGWFEWRSAALTRGLRQYDPDVVCLQEVSIRQQTPVYSQARSVAQAVGFEHSVFTPYGDPAQISSRDQGGIAVLSRWRILDARTRRLPSSRHESFDARAAIFALVDAPEGPLGLITTHLSWRPDEPELRLMQLGLLLKELDRGPWEGVRPKIILAGDLNGTPDEPAIHAARERLQDSYVALHPREPGHTWSRRNPLTFGADLGDRRIDYILCSKEAAVLSCQVILDRPAPVQVSDHFGVFAELEWDSTDSPRAASS